MATDKFKRLKDAYQIIDGIPETAIDLDAILRKEGKSLACGTVACAFGWLSLHPTFLKDVGIKVIRVSRGEPADLFWAHPAYGPLGWPQAAALACGIPEKDAIEIFGTTALTPAASSVINHKELWKNRVLAYIEANS